MSQLKQFVAVSAAKGTMGRLTHRGRHIVTNSVRNVQCFFTVAVMPYHFRNACIVCNYLGVTPVDEVKKFVTSLLYTINYI